MIDRRTDAKPAKAKLLGSENVHGLPLDWAEPKARSRNNLHFQERSRRLLATQNVHGLPTSWDELNLSE